MSIQLAEYATAENLKKVLSNVRLSGPATVPQSAGREFSTTLQPLGLIEITAHGPGSPAVLPLPAARPGPFFMVLQLNVFIRLSRTDRTLEPGDASCEACRN